MSNNYDTLDRFFCESQFGGRLFKRLYAYFKRHTAITDAIHVSFGVGIGLIIGSPKWFYIGMFFLGFGLLGHIFAFIKGGK